MARRQREVKEQLVAAEERARLGREPHDTLAHILTAISVFISKNPFQCKENRLTWS